MNVELLNDEFRAPIINKKDFFELYEQRTQNNNTVTDVNDIVIVIMVN